MKARLTPRDALRMIVDILNRTELPAEVSTFTSSPWVIFVVKRNVESRSKDSTKKVLTGSKRKP